MSMMSGRKPLYSTVRRLSHVGLHVIALLSQDFGDFCLLLEERDTDYEL